jgi:hypothetical protein
MDEISNAIRLLSQSLTSISSQQSAATGDRTTTSQQPQPFSTTGQVHFWPGSSTIHTVPHLFEWPSYSASNMWNLCFLGNANKRIWPYKLISPKVDLPKALCRSNCSRTKRIMNKLIEIATSGRIISNERDITPLNMQSVFDYSYPILLQILYGGSPPPRPQDININTLANRMPRITGRCRRGTRNAQSITALHQDVYTSDGDSN